MRRVNQCQSFPGENESMAIAAFEHGKGSQQPRNVGRPWEWETARKPGNYSPPEPSEETQP